MSALGGVCFFNVSVDIPEGDLELLQQVMNGANVEVDDAAEERKGGANDLGKAFLTAGTAQMAVKFHVPKAVAEAKGVSLQEWIDALLKPVKEHAVEVEKTEETATYTVAGDVAAGRFPLKLRDECTAAGFNFLREKGLIPVEDSSDDDMAWAQDVEW